MRRKNFVEKVIFKIYVQKPRNMFMFVVRIGHNLEELPTSKQTDMAFYLFCLYCLSECVYFFMAVAKLAFKLK